MKNSGGVFDCASKAARIHDIEEIVAQPNFWSDTPRSEQDQLNDERRQINRVLVPMLSIQENIELIEELEGSGEFKEDLDAIFEQVISDVNVMETMVMLSGKMDGESCYLKINAGAGGTEACDWVGMLARMYERWAQNRGWQCHVVDALEDDIAGYRYITLGIKGELAYGYAKAESGVHRLVRISPFDTNKKRHTSFASVEVLPELSNEINVDIRTEDIRVDTFRASGAGGQHVNKTDSAVRITHIPTGVVVSCQSARSQHQNKEVCMRLLKAKLYTIEEEKRQDEINELRGTKKSNSWGSQIRNYTFNPYTKVKDTRTNVEDGNIESVMDGNIDQFIEAFLKYQYKAMNE